MVETHEKWRAIPGYEGVYEVSSRGRVKRIMACQGATPGRILRQSNQNGYLAVTLYKNDVRVKFAVHILVCSAFHGLAPSIGMHVNHKDANKRNNAPDNLEWVTPQQNVAHAVALGLVGGRSLPGEENGRAKLTRDQVLEIRSLRGKVGQRLIAAQYGVARSLVQRIHQGLAWSFLNEWPEDLRVREMPEGGGA